MIEGGGVMVAKKSHNCPSWLYLQFSLIVWLENATCLGVVERQLTFSKNKALRLHYWAYFLVLLTSEQNNDRRGGGGRS